MEEKIRERINNSPTSCKHTHPLARNDYNQIIIMRSKLIRLTWLVKEPPNRHFVMYPSTTFRVLFVLSLGLSHITAKCVHRVRVIKKQQQIRSSLCYLNTQYIYFLLLLLLHSSFLKIPSRFLIVWQPNKNILKLKSCHIKLELLWAIKKTFTMIFFPPLIHSLGADVS